MAEGRSGQYIKYDNIYTITFATFLCIVRCLSSIIIAISRLESLNLAS